MTIKLFFAPLLLGLTAFAPKPPLTVALTGDYVEARTASVFCGACHYNGELVTEGRDAVMAWHMTSGNWKDVDLTGTSAMAQISCRANLSDPAAFRTTQIVIDSSASDQQSRAMVDLITQTGGSHLGRLLPTHRAAVSFVHEGGEYKVVANGFADMTVQALPNNECCTQPHSVWYSPIVPIEHRKVGYTQAADYTAGTNGDTWGREDENSAFYGTFITQP